MVDPIQVSSSVLNTSTNKASSISNVNGISFAEKLSESMKASDLKDDPANKKEGCCGGGQKKDEAVGISAGGDVRTTN